jgi:hypothetical protein
VIVLGNAVKLKQHSVIYFLDGSYRNYTHGIAPRNAVRLIQPTVIGFLEVSYTNTFHGDSLKACRKGKRTQDNTLFRVISLQ